MKEKILSALKTKYSNLGFSDKAFDGVADYLSKTVTDESQVETATDGVDVLLKTFQGESDRLRGEKKTLQTQLDELKSKTPGENKTNPDDLDAKLTDLIDAKVKPIQDELNNYKAKEAQSNRTNQILSQAKQLGIPEWRIKEGFNLAEDADEDSIKSYLSTVKQNIVTASLEKTGGFPIDPKIKPTTEQVDDVLNQII